MTQKHFPWRSQTALLGGLVVFAIALSFFEAGSVSVMFFCWFFVIVSPVVFLAWVVSRQVALAEIFVFQLFLACMLSITISHWPLVLKFKLSEPALTRFARTYESEGNASPSRWVGLFYVKRVDTDRYDGCTWLITRGNGCGLLYGPPKLSQTPGNEWFGLTMAEKWRYTDED